MTTSATKRQQHYPVSVTVTYRIPTSGGSDGAGGGADETTAEQQQETKAVFDATCPAARLGLAVDATPTKVRISVLREHIDALIRCLDSPCFHWFIPLDSHNVAFAATSGKLLLLWNARPGTIAGTERGW